MGGEFGRTSNAGKQEGQEIGLLRGEITMATPYHVDAGAA